MSFLEPSFIQYIDSVAYIYIFNIFLYTFKNFLRAGTSTLKPKISPSIQLGFAPQGFLHTKLYQLILIALPTKYKAQRIYFFFLLLAQTFKYSIKLRKLKSYMAH